MVGSATEEVSDTDQMKAMKMDSNNWRKR